MLDGGDGQASSSAGSLSGGSQVSGLKVSPPPGRRLQQKQGSFWTFEDSGYTITCSSCPDYTISNLSSTHCIIIFCHKSQRLLPDATCENCPLNYEGSPDGKECVISGCREGQMILSNGKCQDCPVYTKLSVTDSGACVSV